MPTQVLAVGNTAADSADTVVAAGSELTVALNDAAGPVVGQDCRVLVQVKDPGGLYFKITELTVDQPALVLSAGTYRFSRLAGGSCGVFSA